MATAVQIEVTVDESGAVTGVNKLGASVSGLGATFERSAAAAKTFNAVMEQGGKEAEVFSEAMEKASAAGATFPEAVEAGSAALQQFRDSLEEVGTAASHAVPQVAAASAAIRVLEGNTTGSIRAAERFLTNTLQLGPALQAAFPVIGALAFLGVIDQLAEKTSQWFADVLIYTDAMKRQYAADVAANNALAGATARLQQAQEDLFTTTHSAQQNISHDIQNETSLRNHQIDQLTRQTATVNELQAATKDYYSFINSKFFNQFGGSSQAGAFDLAKQALDTARANQQAYATQVDATNTQIETSTAKLYDQIAKDDDALAKLREQNERTFENAYTKMLETEISLWDKHNKDLQEMDEITNRTLNDDFKETTKENADGLKQRTKDTEAALKEQQKNYQDHQKQIQQYTQQLGNDLYQLFQGITSGSIGKQILQGFQRLFANILAQWIATVNGIGQVSARGGAGGLLGALGMIFGSGTNLGGAIGGGTGPYGLPAGIAMSDFGSGITSADMLAAGAGAVSTGGAGVGTIGASATSNPVLASVLSAGVGTVAASQQQQSQGGILGGLLSAASLNKLVPLALMGSLLLGSKGGASAITGGALLGALGLAALYGPNAAATAAVAPFAGLLGPLAGGLIGFGVGSATGSPLAGGLSGAGSGALVGLLAGGPIGAAIGGIIGGLAGLFGGLFGGGPSKHDLADKWIQANVVPAINTEVTNFEGFQTDYSTAINDLESLKTNSYNQMLQQFGHDATVDEWNKYVVPAIQQAEDTINGYNNSRNQRSSVNFGLPQFALGGLVNAGGHSAMLAVLHDGERVMTADAVRRYDPILQQIHSASSGPGAAPVPVMGASGGTVNISIVAWDGNSVQTWLRNGGAQIIGTALRKNYTPTYVGMGRG